MHLPGATEMLILMGIVLVLFGGAKLPQLMKGMGEGMREFKKATRDEDEPRPSVPTSTSMTNHNEPPV